MINIAAASSNYMTLKPVIHSKVQAAILKQELLLKIYNSIGVVAVQFRVSSTILQLVFNVSSFYAVLISAVIVVVYSALGGIKAVTFTDVVQIFTFATIIPIISFIIWGTLGDPYKAYLTVTENPLFDYKEVLNFHNPRFLDSLSLFFVFYNSNSGTSYFSKSWNGKKCISDKKFFYHCFSNMPCYYNGDTLDRYFTACR